MLEQKEVEIKGDKYQITQFGARQGFRLGKKVAKIIMPALAASYSNVDEGGQPSLADLIAGASDHIDELDENTVLELLSNTTKNKFAIDFDKEFAGNYSTLFQLLWEIVAFNFADFLDEALGDTSQ